MAKIFLNYRREDTAPLAKLLYDRLADHLGKDRIFKDIDDIDPGEKFAEVLEKRLEDCDIILALIGPKWLLVKDNTQLPRLQDPKDFVRLGFQSGLDSGKRVIPVLVDGASMPKDAQLPVPLKDLPDFQAIKITKSTLDQDLPRLLQAL